MAIADQDFHKNNFNIALALGAKRNAGDAMLAPEGFGGIAWLVKQFPHPNISGGMGIEVPLPGGGGYYEQAPMDTKFEGAVSFLETDAASVKAFLAQVVAGTGFFDARIYEGTIDRHFRSYLLRRCFIKLDVTDRDIENKQQVLMLSGTMYGQFFGEEQIGNLTL
jgi:hypothetical protein